MFYSEKFQSPINSYNVKRMYGVNPDNDPARAAAIGIYPLVEAPEGYSAVAYLNKGTYYEAVPHEFSNDERNSIYRIQRAGTELRELAENYSPIATPDLVDEVGDIEPEQQPRKRGRKKQS